MKYARELSVRLCSTFQFHLANMRRRITWWRTLPSFGGGHGEPARKVSLKYYVRNSIFKGSVWWAITVKVRMVPGSCKTRWGRSLLHAPEGRWKDHPTLHIANQRSKREVEWWFKNKYRWNQTRGNNRTTYPIMIERTWIESSELAETRRFALRMPLESGCRGVFQVKPGSRDCLIERTIACQKCREGRLDAVCAVESG